MFLLLVKLQQQDQIQNHLSHSFQLSLVLVVATNFFFFGGGGSSGKFLASPRVGFPPPFFFQKVGPVLSRSLSEFGSPFFFPGGFEVHHPPSGQPTYYILKRKFFLWSLTSADFFSVRDQKKKMPPKLRKRRAYSISSSSRSVSSRSRSSRSSSSGRSRSRSSYSGRSWSRSRSTPGSSSSGRSSRSCFSNQKKLSNVEKVIQVFVKECRGFSADNADSYVTQECIVDALRKHYNISSSTAKSWITEAVDSGFFLKQQIEDGTPVLTPTPEFAFGPDTYKGMIMQKITSAREYDKEIVRNYVKRKRTSRKGMRYADALFEKAWNDLCNDRLIRSKSGTPESIRSDPPKKKSSKKKKASSKKKKVSPKKKKASSNKKKTSSKSSRKKKTSRNKKLSPRKGVRRSQRLRC